MQAGLVSGSVRLSQLTKPFLVKQIRVFVVKRKIAGIEIQARQAQLILQCREKLPAPTFQWWIIVCSGRKTTTLKTQIYSFTCKESKVGVECLSASYLGEPWFQISIRTPVILARPGGGVPHSIEANADVTAQSTLQPLVSTPLLNTIY